VRWTARDQWHVTLAFYGEVPDRDVPVLAAALGDAAALVDGPPEAAIGVRTCRLGRRVLALPVSGLDPLAAAVRGRTAPWVGREGPFVAHLTVARARGRGEIPGTLVGASVEPGPPPAASVEPGPPPGAGALPAPRWRVAEVCLVASTASPGGGPHRYRTVAAAGIGRPPPR
jgi:2'-5' RNA ligase